MLESKYQREREVFEWCLAVPPGEREKILQASGEDEALQERVRRLLAAHDRANDVTAPLTPIEQEQPTLPPWIGPYRILHLLGEGGMGSVYAAEQIQPLRRKVALKVIKLGMDSRQVVARFHAERQALAVMDHPQIAKVLDAGATPDGRPYFVMELVEGVPLLAYCDRHGLDLRERVRLTAGICHAVQHAHVKGVVHRDLKPGNILAAEQAGAYAPKVIDFGIAKAIEGDLLENAVETRMHQPIGTPAYMSPEQAAAGRVDIDTRSDIYSLGVVLFELLTGALPIDPKGLPAAEFLERLGQRAFDVSPPSAVLRRAGREREARELEGDLDWICLKALSADRDQRYETAVALAEDLQRYLDDEPVSARAPTALYRLKKLFRRRRAEMLAASVASLALVTGLVAASAALVRAARAERLALREAETAREISQFLTGLFEISDPYQSLGEMVTARELLERGAHRVEQELNRQPLVQARLLETLGRVYNNLGLYNRAHDLAGRALAQIPPSDPALRARAWTTSGVAARRLGKFDESRKALQAALQIEFSGQSETAGAANILNELGSLDWQLGRYQDAVENYRRAIAICDRLLGPESIEAAKSLRGIAMVRSSQNQPAEAEQIYRQLQPVFERIHGPNHPLVADNLDSLALAQMDLNRMGEARQNLERALSIRRTVLGEQHPVLAYSYLNLARLNSAEKRITEARRQYEEGIRIRESALGAYHPRTADIVESLAVLHARQGNFKAALPLFQRSLGIYRTAYGDTHPETLESQRNLAILYALQGRQDDALRHLNAALEGGYGPDLHLEEKVFDPLRRNPGFLALEKRVSQIEPGGKKRPE